ncbi:MAG: hypothetical protein ACJAWW_002358 [Sulfurimonas sp.]|jgi:hypothetical protein
MRFIKFNKVINIKKLLLFSFTKQNLSALNIGEVSQERPSNLLEVCTQW